MSGQARVWAVGALIAVAASCAPLPPPAVVTTPKYPDYPRLDIPADLKASPETLASQDEAWRRLQSGDLSGARTTYAAILQSTPAFYPAAAGLGFVALASQDFRTAAGEFSAALATNARYKPALQGRVDAAIASGDDDTALAGLKAIVTLDPGDQVARDRLEAVRLRLVEHQIETGRQARLSGRLDEAQNLLSAALVNAPASATVLRELAEVELARDALADAEGHARRAAQEDASDAESWAALGDVLDKAGKTREAADAFGKAFDLDPRPAWRDRRDALVARATEDAEPEAFRAIAHAPTVTRGDVAALIDRRLGAVLERSPRHVDVVAIDALGDRAADAILKVTQAGLMDVYPNHTFLPNEVVRRSDLAGVVSRTLGLMASEQSTDVSRWRAAKPRFSDLEETNAGYPAAALAVSADVMTPDGDRFNAGRPVTGAELVAAMTRLQRLLR